MSNTPNSDCPLCQQDGGTVLWRNDKLRIVLPAEPGYPGFCRVIWQAHHAEMTDLPAEDRQYLMGVVFAVEQALREVAQPDKINLASLGNMVAHLHWHVIPRFRDDPHFPNAVWCQTVRDHTHSHSIDVDQLADAISRHLTSR